MKIVFVVHYFPPLNSTGSRRVLAFVKYLSRMGHDITVITTRKTGYDGQLSEDMPTYCQVIELGQEKKGDKTNNHSNQPRSSLLIKALINIRRSLTVIFGQLIDHRIIFALRFLFEKPHQAAQQAFLDADIIVTSTPPWPVHLAGYWVSRRYKKPWVVDYRDQFSGNHIHPGNWISGRIEKWIDHIFLRQATQATVVSWPMREYYITLSKNVITIENGYDEEFFEQIKGAIFNIPESTNTVVIRYLGTIYKYDSIPRNFFVALREVISHCLADDGKQLLVEFYGQTDLLKTFIEAEFPELTCAVKVYGMISYREAVEKMITADALLMIETSSENTPSAKGILTTKLFEYLAAQRPIVADIKPTTLIAEVIEQSGLGLVCSTSADEIRIALLKLMSGEYAVTPNREFIATFSRQEQAKRFESVLRACL